MDTTPDLATLLAKQARPWPKPKHGHAGTWKGWTATIHRRPPGPPC
ncbi:MAG: hypothetical protein IT158_24095 [Bryobacterales bacterium]|nr:hypothetical protein [Bryobacterales bacterium]